MLPYEIKIQYNLMMKYIYFQTIIFHVSLEIVCPLPYRDLKAKTNLIAMASTQHDADEVTKEARKKKIKELEASLFGNTLDEDGSSWNPR